MATVNLTTLNNLQATESDVLGQKYLLNVYAASAGVIASDGVSLPIDSLAVVYSGGAPSTPNAVWVNTVEYLGNTYTQTYTFDSSGNIASQTGWVLV